MLVLHILTTAFLFFTLMPVSAQDLMTATTFFERISQNYQQIHNYMAEVQITTDEDDMKGTAYFLAPNKLRIDFTIPPNQTIVSDGETVSIYVPRYNVVLQQELDNDSPSGTTGLATNAGLQLLKEHYSIAYLDGPEARVVPELSPELLYVLRLEWKTNKEGFRELILYITEDLKIRRIEGITVYYQKMSIDYTNIQFNQGVPNSIFDYDLPASANIYDNFLFEKN